MLLRSLRNCVETEYTDVFLNRTIPSYKQEKQNRYGKTTQPNPSVVCTVEHTIVQSAD